MTKKTNAPAPMRELPATDWEHYQLYKDVREAIALLADLLSHGNPYLRNYGD